MEKKKRIFFDMDNCLVNFQSGIDSLGIEWKDAYQGRYDECPGIFREMAPLEGAVEAVMAISGKYECWILSTSPWNNQSALMDKLDWIKRYFGRGPENPFYKRVVFTHRKDLEMYADSESLLIDDRLKNGSEVWEEAGRLIQFGTAEYPTWDVVRRRLGV